MTRADLTEEVCQTIELPKKESNVVVAPYLTASSAPCDPATRWKSADSEASIPAKDERASDGIQKLKRESKCHRRRYLSSNLARNFVMASSESEQATGFVERGTACYSTGISGDASWPAGHNAQEVALGEAWRDLLEGRFGPLSGLPKITQR